MELGSADYDVQHYDIQIALDPNKPYEIEAEVKIDAVIKQAGLEKISLDFVSLNFEIDQTLVDGQEAAYERRPSKLVLILPDVKEKGTALNINIAYHGKTTRFSSRFVPWVDHLGLFYPQGQEEIFIASEPDGARFWFPCNDHPRDKASFRYTVTVPGQYRVAANGLETSSETNDGYKEVVWEHPGPMATYLATIAVGKFERIETSSPVHGILIQDYVYPEYLTQAEEAFGNTAEAVDWMIDLLGPYPFESYGHVTVHAPGFALETQTMVLMSVYMLRENVMIHELAHMYFGDWVSLDSWGEMWRNEGFPSYMQALWAYRDDPEGLKAHMDALTEVTLMREDLEPLNALSPNNLFDDETYVKGKVVAYALHQEVGDEAFFEGLRLYFERYGGGTASDAEFIAAMEEASGQDLGAFFEMWLGE